jgi:hypothetical protein
MQKIEKWRIVELEQVLNQISILLREGKNPEWDKNDLELNSLQRLIQNIIVCFDGGSSLRSLILHHGNSNRMAKLNQEFGHKRNFLSEILTQMEAKWAEPIN